mgnify:FL=1
MTEKDIKRFKSTQKAKDKSAKEAAKDPIVTQKKTGSDWNYYVSANPEKISWDMTVTGVKYKGLWNKDRTHLVWRIPNGATEKFEQHIFFKHRRIIKGDE